MQLYPFRFEPIFRQYLWGGRRLGTMLGKPIDRELKDIAESWEIVDHEEDSSIVANGPLAGKSLNQLILQFQHELVGADGFERIANPQQPTALRNRFPLLLKYLDANRILSVQVHPDDDYATGMPIPDLGKTEAWVVVHAEPESVIYAGLHSGIGKQELRAAIEAGRTEECLHSIRPQAGDCIFIPSGTVHAIGAGLVIAEIQQASDTTFRLFDWNRTDSTGKSRPLHIEQALEVIDFDRGPVGKQKPDPVPSNGGDLENLVRCDKFILQRRRFDRTVTIGGDGRFRILTLLSGAARLERDPAEQPLTRSDTILIPAGLPELELRPSQPVELLEIHLP